MGALLAQRRLEGRQVYRDEKLFSDAVCGFCSRGRFAAFVSFVSPLNAVVLFVVALFVIVEIRGEVENLHVIRDTIDMEDTVMARQLVLLPRRPPLDDLIAEQ